MISRTHNICFHEDIRRKKKKHQYYAVEKKCFIRSYELQVQRLATFDLTAVPVVVFAEKELRAIQKPVFKNIMKQNGM